MYRTEAFQATAVVQDNDLPHYGAKAKSEALGAKQSSLPIAPKVQGERRRFESPATYIERASSRDIVNHERGLKVVTHQQYHSSSAPPEISARALNGGCLGVLGQSLLCTLYWRYKI